LVDDKGTTMLLCFGLPPVVHSDDVVRGVLASLLICWQLKRLHGLPAPAVGVAVGEHVFCGVVGGRTRREYSIIGDSANIAARLMQRAKGMPGGGVLCSESVFDAIGNGSSSPGSAAMAFHFVELHAVSGDYNILEYN